MVELSYLEVAITLGEVKNINRYWCSSTKTS